jgi:putative membrane protein
MSGSLLAGLGNFGMYIVVALAIFAAFVYLYEMVTPYKEFELIKNGNAAASCSLAGAVLGFVLPVASVISNSVSILDVIIWSAIAMSLQIAVFLALWKIFPRVVAGVHDGQLSCGIFLGATALSIGILNAACLTY